LGCLVLACKPGDHTPYVALIVTYPDLSVGMRHHIVPGRHLLVEITLAGIPLWGNVSVSRAEHHQHFVAIGHILPNSIVSGYMGMQHPQPAIVGMQSEG